MEIQNESRASDPRTDTRAFAWERWHEAALEWPVRLVPTHGELSWLEELDPRLG